MATYGYIRKSYPITTTEQLKIVMTYECDSISIEENDFKQDQELRLLLKEMQTHDVLVVTSLDVFGKNMKRMMPIIKLIEEKELILISSSDQLDTEKDKRFFSTFYLLSKMDASCQSQRVKQSVAVARSNGSVSGRPPISIENIKLIQRYYSNGNMSMRQIARKCDVSLGTVHKYINFSEEQLSV